MDILKGEIKIYSINDDEVYEVDFMNLVVDKADGLKVVDCDNHFCEFTGVHPSKIKQGKLFLHNIIKPIYREEIMRALCKKNSPYVCGKEYKSFTNIGIRPTWRLSSPLSETHIFDFSGDLYNENIRIELVRYLRGEKQFSSLDELEKQLQYDKSSII